MAYDKKAWLEGKKQESREMVESIVNGIIELADAGAKFEYGWNRVQFMARNFTTGTIYKGCNALNLSIQAAARGATDLRFATWNAIKGSALKQGKKATLKDGAMPFLVWKPTPYRVKAKKTAEGEEDSFISRLGFTPCHVWNIEDVQGIDLPKVNANELETFDENTFFEELFKAFGVKIVYGGGEAFYRRTDDEIHLPEKKNFKNEAAFYATALHEFYHWTGDAKRDNRTKGAVFGDENYAKEELRAEIFSAIAASIFGLGERQDASAAYLKNWASSVKGEFNNNIMAAARDAMRILDAVIDLANGNAPKLAWAKEMDFSNVPAPFKISDEEKKWLAEQDSQNKTDENEEPEKMAA